MIASDPALLPVQRGPHWLLNPIGFQAAWLVTALSAANGLHWVGPLAVAVAIGLHLACSARPDIELRLMLVALLLGVAVEHGLLWSGLIRYPDHPTWVPLWMLLLWPLFATLLNGSLRWLQGHLFVAALAGAVGGPLAYWGGQALGAMEIRDPWAALLSLAAIWSIVTPLLLGVVRLMADRPDRGAAS